jgi:hypothetical protein
MPTRRAIQLLTSRFRVGLLRVPQWHGIVLLMACAFLVTRAFTFYPFMADDSSISLRYARRLLDGHGLTWTEGLLSRNPSPRVKPPPGDRS